MNRTEFTDVFLEAEDYFFADGRGSIPFPNDATGKFRDGGETNSAISDDILALQFTDAGGKDYRKEYSDQLDDDEYTEIEPEEDHARMYGIQIEGDRKVRVSLVDAAATHTALIDDTHGNLSDEDVIFQIRSEDEPLDVTYSEYGDGYSIEDGSEIRISSDGVAGIYKFSVTMDGGDVEAVDSDGNPVYFTMTGDVTITVGGFLDD